jgi:hypothetical protein
MSRGGELIGARRTTEAEVDAARVQAFEHAELLSHHQRGMVGQHHATSSDPNGRGGCGEMSDQHGGRGAGHSRVVVVLSYPVAGVPEALRVLHEVDGVSQRVGRRKSVRNRAEVEHRERNGERSHGDHGTSELAQSRLAESLG